MTRLMLRAMGMAPFVAFGLLAFGCTDSPSPVAPTASAASAPAFVLTVRSGVEGLPALPGATVRVGSTTFTTDRNGQVSVPVPARGADEIYTVTAPGHVGYESRFGLGLQADLWPLVDGTTRDWVFAFSYTTNYAVEYLKRPVDDIHIEVPPALRRAITPWTAAARVISEATFPFAVRIVDSAPDGLLMVESGTPCPRRSCLAVTPSRLDAPDYALEQIARLTGFDLAGSRRRLGPPADTPALMTAERVALRMRFRRVPGTIWNGENNESDWEIVDDTGKVRSR